MYSLGMNSGMLGYVAVELHLIYGCVLPPCPQKSFNGSITYRSYHREPGVVHT